MRIETFLSGQTPYVMHNVRLADPDDEFTQAIGRINDKGKKMTEDDRREKARLQWNGCLYLGENGHNGPVVPTANLRRCFQEAAKTTNNGKDITRAVIPIETNVPLIYDGPRDIRELFRLPQFVYTTMVGINRRKVQSTRPIFPKWQVKCIFELITEILDLDVFVDVVQRAGRIEGLGDNRINGYGRFSSEVREI